MKEGKKMGGNSPFIETGLRSLTEKNRGKGLCLPIALAIPICATLFEMIRVMDFSALNAYLNAAAKILSGK